ncbi:ATP synthase F1 subunit gamma [Candidatus Saccharibacteria bacterium]|nr:ATP synthase F1 subunit gamma [Candidatus Saccharibacteria bacterium]MCB9817139.1 ATP synthase F1 subunit gamma [Candidatus Nomurabacteria bacterium]HPD98647.1 ATP synthase F1 subunit gamma [Candidatus Saccharibacteria bacterium]
MASQQAVKQRIQSVSNTRQITKAMQLVAASKLRKSQEAVIGPKAYIENAKALLATLAGHPGALVNPLFKTPNSKGALTIIVTSDRGLAGAYNANVLKAAAKHLKDHPGMDRVITVGKYASRFISKLKDINSLGAYELDSHNLNSEVVTPVLAQSIDEFVAGNVASVDVVYTKYISTVKHEVIIERVLPIKNITNQVKDRLFEPNAEYVFEVAITRALEAQMLQYLLEARASEQASRMLAMKNATDNAGDLIDDLRLEYNNARQAKITQELAEISGGAEALS